MKTLYFSIIAISGIVIIAGHTPYVYAPCARVNGTEVCGLPPIPVTINLPTHVYSAGDTINVTGHVDRKLLQSNELLFISFYDSKRNLVLGPEILSEVNGTYSYHLKLGADFGPTGQYSIQINHDKTTDAGSWFMFIAAPYQLQINGLIYPINYKITSGYLDKISLNNTGNSLTAYIADTMNGGQLILELPRKIIDSKSYNGTDSQFAVLVGYPPNMNEANFTELQNDSSTRTLLIDFPYDPATNAIGDWYIKITGTQVMKSENVVKSPLEQFKSGIKAEDVKCKEGFQLVIKSEDGSPACVKPDDAYILIYRGWAKEFIQSVTWTNQSTCGGTEVPSGDYRKNIFPVLIMSPNSTATVCVTYNFVSDWQSYHNKDVYPHGILETCCFVHLGWYSTPVSSNKFEILANPPLFNVTSVNNGSKISVTYKIYAKSDSKGFYDTSVPFDGCLSYPLAVGYGPSEVDATKFHADFAIPCFASIENVDSVNIVSGMTYKEVQFP